MKIKARNVLCYYAMFFVNTVDMKTLVFVALTQHCIQSNEVWKLYSTLYKVASHACQDEKPSVLWV